jgi:hypothetical protein
MRRITVTHIAAILAALAAATPAVAATPAGGSWSGTTSQTDAQGVKGIVSFTVSKSRKKVTRFEWQEQTTCDSGKTFSSTNTSRGLKIGKRGHLDAVGTFNGSAGNGYTAQHGASLHGRFTTKHKFKATFEDVVVIFDPSGQQVDTCHSGTAKLTAKYR